MQCTDDGCKVEGPTFTKLKHTYGYKEVRTFKLQLNKKKKKIFRTMSKYLRLDLSCVNVTIPIEDKKFSWQILGWTIIRLLPPKSI